MSSLIHLTTEILAAQGALRYLTDWDKELATRIARRAENRAVDQMPTYRSGVGEPELRLRVTQVGPRVTRRFDYAGAKKQAPALYREHVVLTPPKAPLMLTFRAKGRGRSTAWDELRSVGWQRQNTRWGSMRGAEFLTLPDLGDQLRQARAAAKGVKQREADLRLEMALAVAAAGRSVPDLSSGDGTVQFTPTSPTQKISIDLALSIDGLKPFVRDNKPSEGYTKVWFSKVAETGGYDPEGDQDPWEGD